MVASGPTPRHLTGHAGESVIWSHRNPTGGVLKVDPSVTPAAGRLYGLNRAGPLQRRRALSNQILIASASVIGEVDRLLCVFSGWTDAAWHWLRAADTCPTDLPTHHGPYDFFQVKDCPFEEPAADDQPGNTREHWRNFYQSSWRVRRPTGASDGPFSDYLERPLNRFELAATSSVGGYYPHPFGRPNLAELGSAC